MKTAHLIEDRINASYAEMNRMLSATLYGDDRAPPTPTRWIRFKRYVSVRRERICDAWLVLTGQADIGY